MMKNTGYAFVGVEKLLWGILFPCLFFRKSKYLPSIIVALNTIPVNKSGMFLQNLVTSIDEKFSILERASAEMIMAMKGEREFQSLTTLRWLRRKGVTEEKLGMTSKCQTIEIIKEPIIL